MAGEWQLPGINPDGSGGQPFPGYARWLQQLIGQLTANPILQSPGPRPAPPPPPPPPNPKPGLGEQPVTRPAVAQTTPPLNPSGGGWYPSDPDEAFVGNPDAWPLPVPAPVAAPVTAAAVRAAILASVRAALGWGTVVFWPGELGDDPWYPLPSPQPAPKGPTRRPRITRTPDTPARTPGRLPDLVQPRPVWTDDRPVPTEAPRPSVLDEPVAVPQPVPVPLPAPKPLPTLPSAPAWFNPLPLLPFLPLLQSPPRAPAPLRVRPPVGLPSTQPGAQPFPFAQPTPQPADPCREARQRERQKRKRKQCRNPVVSRKVQTRGNSRYSIITRKLQCPV